VGGARETNQLLAPGAVHRHAHPRTSRPRPRALTLCGSKPDRTLRSTALKHGESRTRLLLPPPSPSADAGSGRVRLDCAARRRRIVSHASTCRQHGTSPVPVFLQSDFPSAAGAARHAAPPGLRSCCCPRPTRPPPPQRTDRSPTSLRAFFPLTPCGRRPDAVPSQPPLRCSALAVATTRRHQRWLGRRRGCRS